MLCDFGIETKKYNLFSMSTSAMDLGERVTFLAPFLDVTILLEITKNVAVFIALGGTAQEHTMS